jgi:hypothetical protein
MAPAVDPDPLAAEEAAVEGDDMEDAESDAPAVAGEPEFLADDSPCHAAADPGCVETGVITR